MLYTQILIYTPLIIASYLLSIIALAISYVAMYNLHVQSKQTEALL